MTDLLIIYLAGMPLFVFGAAYWIALDEDRYPLIGIVVVGFALWPVLTVLGLLIGLAFRLAEKDTPDD